MSSRTMNARLDGLFSKIDAQEKTISELGNAQEKKISELGDEIVSLKAKIISNEKRLASIESKLNGIEKRLSALEVSGRKLEKLAYYHLDPKLYSHAIEEWYKDQTGNILDLDNPQTYNEKIQWMKLYDPDTRKTLLADKLLVRDWVREKIGEEYLIPLLAVYQYEEEIDFDALPESFVLKANHGCAMNIIVKNKAEADINEIRSKARFWLSKNFAFSNGYELQYDNIPRRLIVEQYMENADGDLPDYKFWCFDGKCKMICFIHERKDGAKMAFYDPQWNKLPYYYAFPQIQEEIPKPDKLSEMLEIAEKLAEGFRTFGWIFIYWMGGKLNLVK